MSVDRFYQLADQSNGFQNEQCSVVYVDRLVLFGMEPSVGDICELATTAVDSFGECLQPGLKSVEGVRHPTFVLIQRCLEKVGKYKVDVVLVAPYWPVLIPYSPGVSLRDSANNSSPDGPSGGSRRAASTNAPKQSTPANRVEIIRSGFEDRGPSGNVIELFIGADRNSTSVVY